MENVAIYCRLSVDDGTNLESMSISNQKDIITKFVEDNNWNIYDYYIDDGFSGTNFNRPSFERMIEDIKLGYIDIVITKDLSRLGRDYIKTGTFIEEIFPQYNVRYIAISDGVDTKDTIDEMVPFKNIINEFYAKDVSNKIRFTLNNNMKTGKVVKTAIPLYGYMYDENSNRIPDPQTKDIVSRIFDMYIEGNLPAEIAKKFKEEKILTPSYYNYQKYHYGSTNVDKKLSSGPYEWQAESIRRIIKNKEYLGHYIRGKTQTAFKTHKLTVVEEDKRYIFENKFEPLVTQEQFDRANQLLEIVRKRVAKTPNRYAGLAYCAVCGKRLRHKEDFRVSRKNFVRLTCRNTNCTKEAGTILYEDLDKVMVKEIMTLKEVILSNKEEFLKKAEQASNSNHYTDNFYRMTKEKEMYEANLAKVDKYIKTVFEQYANGILPEATYNSMVSTYKSNYNELKLKISDLEDRISKEKGVKYDYKTDAYKLLELLNTINKVNCTEAINLTSIVSKILIKTDGIRKRREKQNKEITIVYKKMDVFLHTFISDCTK